MENLKKFIQYQFCRSGGPGGQNVNKVESACIARIHISRLPYSKDLFQGKSNKRGFIQVKSSTFRTQSQNKAAATDRLLLLVAKYLKKETPRIETSIPLAVKEQRMDFKKLKKEKKNSRKMVVFE